ncbi:MAG TPA: ORF6N domain-containing protein [Bacteroidota bacterium]
MMTKKKQPLARIESLILTVRGHKVVLDSDLAKIYGVTTARLNQQVRRNLDRFPEDFFFQIAPTEWDEIQALRSQNATLKDAMRSRSVTGSTQDDIQALRLQNATLKKGRGKHRKYLPYAFTEHGAIMAANVLKSKTAVQMSVFVVRAFVRLRELAITHRELTEKLKELELRVGQHDTDIAAIIEAIRQLMKPPESPKRRLGFYVKEPGVRYGTR